jgi:hypothetical protein
VNFREIRGIPYRNASGFHPQGEVVYLKIFVYTVSSEAIELANMENWV